MTIHYRIRAADTLTDNAIHALTQRARAHALTLGTKQVSKVIEVESDFPLNWYFREAGDAEQWPAGPLPPQRGWIFSFDPGADSESVLLGLCRFPNVPCWHWRGWCKTQYAAQHGWEHFLATHRRVLDAIAFWRELGADVQVIDEGGYWETRSETALRAKLGEYDRLVAAFAGALKDSGAKVEGAIFSDPRFEQLEAEGQADFRERITRVLRDAPELLPRKSKD